MIWVLEVLVRGAWKPTTTVWLSATGGAKVVAQMNADNEGRVAYRLAAYVRKA